LKLFKEWGKGNIKENDEGMISTMIHCKNFYKFHNVPLVQQKYDNKKITFMWRWLPSTQRKEAVSISRDKGTKERNFN
jgi:hypothetical protein